MMDVIGALFAGGLSVAVVGTLVGLSSASSVTKGGALAVAGGWLALIVTLAAVGSFTPGLFAPVPTGALPFLACLAVLFGGWYAAPWFRDMIASVPLAALVGINVGRLGGLFFLLLYVDDRLSAPFAPIAGLGDIATAALAIPLSAMLLIRPDATHGLRLWNAFGALDLIVAVTLGLLSAPGTPFRIFTDWQGTETLTQLPWLLVPSLLVPLYLFTHFAMAQRLRAARPFAISHVGHERSAA